MPRSRDDLGAGEWAVLALLAEQPTHGFAVARAMSPEGEIGKVWTMRRPLVYRAIDLLTEDGFVRAAGTEPSSSGPRRMLVEATPAGRRALTGWLAEPVEHVRDARSLLMLKLLFLARGDVDQAPLLTAQRKRFESSGGAARRSRSTTPTGSIRCCCAGAWSRRPRRFGSSTGC